MMIAGSSLLSTREAKRWRNRMLSNGVSPNATQTNQLTIDRSFVFGFAKLEILETSLRYRRSFKLQRFATLRLAEGVATLPAFAKRRVKHPSAVPKKHELKNNERKTKSLLIYTLKELQTTLISWQDRHLQQWVLPSAWVPLSQSAPLAPLQRLQ
jgi:hypothetical protein